MTEHRAENTLVTTAGSSRATVGLARWALAAGRPVVLSDGSRTDLVLAGQDASTSQVGFVIRHTSGFLTVAMSSEDCDRLDLPPMVSGRSNARGPDQCVPVIRSAITVSER